MDKELAIEGEDERPGNWIDRSWKEILVTCFDEALEFFVPELAQARDESQSATTDLGPELFAIGQEDNKGMRRPDVVASVPLKGGGEQKVAFFIEQQHSHDPDLPLRMFEEFYRLSDKMRTWVSALAIFTGEIRELNNYRYDRFGTTLTFAYNSYSVAKADAEVLAADGRPFAVAVLAAKRMLEAGGDPQKRSMFARELRRLLRERGYKDKLGSNMLLFIARIMRLEGKDIPKETKEEWEMSVITMEEAAERIRMRNAYEAGLEKGKSEMAEKMLANGIDPAIVANIAGLSVDEVRSIGRI